MSTSLFIDGVSVGADVSRKRSVTSFCGLAFVHGALPTDPIGTTTVTFSGVNAGSEIRVYLPDGTEVAGVESCDPDHVLIWPVYAGGSSNNTVRITILLRGFRIQKFPYAVTLGAQTLPIFQIVDLGYFNPI